LVEDDITVKMATIHYPNTKYSDFGLDESPLLKGILVGDLIPFKRF
jgi:hypothetical protein